MFMLKLKMWLLLSALFGIIYMIFTIVGLSLGITNFYFYLLLSLAMVVLQYFLGPKIIEWTMGVRYIKENESPELYQMVKELAQKAHVPVPKVGVSHLAIPNAFAFGRWASDGRVCVTKGILDLLEPEELRAVLGHEITHLRNRDVLFITLLSVIPMILYRLAWSMMYYPRYERRRDSGNTMLIGMAAFFFYFLTNLLVLYASRIREYFADRGSVALGNQPSQLASALYKLVYGSARLSKDTLRQAEGLKAFFVNDPSRSLTELKELSQLDANHSGTIDPEELAALRSMPMRLSFADRMMEVLSTHPNMLKRIRQLSQYQQSPREATGFKLQATGLA